MAKLIDMLTKIAQGVRDTGWKEVTYGEGVKAYSDTTKLKYRRIGNTVTLMGAATTTSALLADAGDNKPLITTLPTGFRPQADVVFVNQCNGTLMFTTRISPNGNVVAERLRNIDSAKNSYESFQASGAWLPIDVTFITDDPFPSGGGYRLRRFARLGRRCAA